jgi:hypothetical protein
MAGRHVTRRDFLARAASLSAVWPLAARWALAAPAGGVQTPATLFPRDRRGPFVTFDEPGFPVVDVASLLDLPGSVAAGSTADLGARLAAGAVLVWRHGSAFPEDAWPDLARFLENGGSLLYLGGEPFTRPVTGPPGGRRVEPRTVVFLQSLRLNQSYRVPVGGGTLRPAPALGRVARPLPPDAWASVLEPRLTETTDFPSESGSPGQRDAIVRPLADVTTDEAGARFPVAAAAYAIDRLRGRFAGGRWVFWLISAPPDDAALTGLLAEATRPPYDLRLDPTFGCFYAGEQASVIVRAYRPGATDTLPATGTIALDGPGPAHDAVPVQLDVGEHGTARIALPGDLRPGLHRATLDLPALGRVVTGFWMFDPDLFASGDTLSFDGFTLRRDGRPEPVVGTTVMSATVHRDFLFEPNAAVWDDTFGEIASLGVNLVRTGLWSGWRKISLDANVVDEGVVRALQAYYLTARSHGVPVLFNAFAFTPEAFGGADPYFDPRALEGQRAFLTTLARRMAPARELLWDLINEPSFASPDRLWSLRPSGSPFERRAFTAWLAARYGAETGTGTPDWQAVVRRRWRLRPDEGIGLPGDADFQDAYLPGTRRPYRALDYALFAQDAFANWIETMRSALRDGGSTTGVTVGQDEAGLSTSPSPLFFHRAVDFASMHTWWNNDELLWDGLMAKPGGAPLLVSETGIMQHELLSGEAVRDPAEFANLLSRKLAYAFAAGAFGVVEWVYDVNPYIANDNEAAIGLRRVDGSYKPEHRVVADVAAFVRRHRARFDGYVEPDIALIVPTADLLSPRDTATQATRAAVRACYETLGVRVRAVPDHRAAQDLGRPRLIVLPACRGVSDAGWNAVLSAVDAGATLACSGWFDADDAGLPATRLGLTRRPLRIVEACANAQGRRDEFRFSGTLDESWYAAVGDAPTIVAHGRGAILHHPLPIEWADPTPAVPAFYGRALAHAGLMPLAAFDAAGAGVVAVVVPFRTDWLLVAVNESSASRRLEVSRPGRHDRLSIDVPAARATLAFIDPQAWAIRE